MLARGNQMPKGSQPAKVWLVPSFKCHQCIIERSMHAAQQHPSHGCAHARALSFSLALSLNIATSRNRRCHAVITALGAQCKVVLHQ
jgi:hypothetical protein